MTRIAACVCGCHVFIDHHEAEVAPCFSAHEHQFDFNEAVSLLVNCDSQEEIDRYWKELSAVPESEQCGWLKDRFGVSWQITPARLEQMFETGSAEQIRRVTEAFLGMKKLDLAKLEAAFSG